MYKSTSKDGKMTHFAAEIELKAPKKVKKKAKKRSSPNRAMTEKKRVAENKRLNAREDRAKAYSEASNEKKAAMIYKSMTALREGEGL